MSVAVPLILIGAACCASLVLADCVLRWADAFRSLPR